MTQKEKDLLSEYFYRHFCSYEEQLHYLQAWLRTRNIDVVDCFELALAIERFNIFRQTVRDIRMILKISSPDNVKE